MNAPSPLKNDIIIKMAAKTNIIMSIVKSKVDFKAMIIMEDNMMLAVIHFNKKMNFWYFEFSLKIFDSPSSVRPLVFFKYF
jgi:hypothetical protein